MEEGIALELHPTLIGVGLRVSKPTVRIDGHEHHLGWGEHFLPASPGLHTVAIRPASTYANAPDGSRKAQIRERTFLSVDVVVPEGGTARVRFEGGPTFFGLLKGKPLLRIWVVEG